MKTVWKGRKKAYGRDRRTDYEIMLSVVGRTRADGKEYEDWQTHRLNFTFRGDALGWIDANDYTRLMCTPIAPNSDRVYFKFFKDGENPAAVKISKAKGGSRIASFSFDSEEEYTTTKKHWQKYYDLKYDKNESLYYIDVKTPLVEKRFK